MREETPIAVGAPGRAAAEEDSEFRTIDLARLIMVIWRRKYVVFGTAVLGLVVAMVISFLLHPKYDAVARLQPPTSRDGGMISIFPTRNLGDTYLGLLTSRTVADDVIEHQHLKDYFHTTKPSPLRRSLAAMTTVRVDKDQFVSVIVRAAEPETAMRVANEYVDALYRLNQSIATAEAEHRLEYFEGPLQQEKNRLADAEEDLKRAQQSTGMILPEAQVRMGVSALGQLKQEIAEREVQLAAVRTGGTENNPRVIELKSQISTLYGQLARMEADNGGTGGKKNNVPELTLAVDRKAREVKYHETLFGILSRQSENARVDQSYTQQVAIVDRAVIPDEKSWPSRKLILLIGLFVGGALGLFFVIIQGVELPRRVRDFALGLEGGHGDVSHR
jgi:tyrosine-protein kinase Etk/Wzc